jgi:hypothetical protein
MKEDQSMSHFTWASHPVRNIIESNSRGTNSPDLGYEVHHLDSHLNETPTDYISILQYLRFKLNQMKLNCKMV